VSVTREQARDAARRALDEQLGTSAAAVAIVDRATREEDFGWIFFWQSRARLAGGDASTALTGNAPLLVDRLGRVHWTGTARPVRFYVEELRRKGAFDGVPLVPGPEGESHGR
jgi:hypothetical protein